MRRHQDHLSLRCDVSICASRYGGWRTLQTPVFHVPLPQNWCMGDVHSFVDGLRGSCRGRQRAALAPNSRLSNPRFVNPHIAEKRPTMRMERMWRGTIWILINKTTPFFCTFQPRKNSGFVLRCLARTLNGSARHLDLPPGVLPSSLRRRIGKGRRDTKRTQNSHGPL